MDDLDLGEFACKKVNVSFAVVSASPGPKPILDDLFDPDPIVSQPDTQVYSPVLTGVCVHGGKNNEELD